MLTTLVTTTELAAAARCTRQTVANLIRRGELRAVRIGRVWRVPLAAARALLGQADGAPAERPGQGEPTP